MFSNFGVRKIVKLSEEKKRILSNFVSLSTLELANYILPLITLPYLVRVLGPERFGLVAFAQSFIQYIIIFTDYGFNLSATRNISINRADRKKVSEIFCAVMIIKLIFMLIGLVAVFLVVFFTPRFRPDLVLYLLTFGMVLGFVLFPIWFFQGMERMKFITFINLLARLIFVVSIFVFVGEKADYILVPLLNSLGYITGGVVSILLVKKHFGVKFSIPSAENIVRELKEGWHLFISTMAISLYTVSNTFILGIFTNNTLVGYFSSAEKLIRAAQRLLDPLSRSVYPYISKLAVESPEKAIKFIKKILFIMGGCFLLISCLIFVAAKPIVLIILGEQYLDSVIVLRILALLPFVVALSNVFGMQTMLNFGMKKVFSRILVGGALINITLAVILVPLFDLKGISISVLATECFVTTAMYFYLRHQGIRLI